MGTVSCVESCVIHWLTIHCKTTYVSYAIQTVGVANPYLTPNIKYRNITVILKCSLWIPLKSHTCLLLLYITTNVVSELQYRNDIIVKIAICILHSIEL